MNRRTTNNFFPSQVVSDAEKISYEYGLKVARAIEREWFDNSSNGSRYNKGLNNFHNLRLYARGEQSIQKYKDELSINGDLSYLNLDWKPVPIIPKFVDIVVNGIAEKLYDIKAYSQDQAGVSKRTAYMEQILDDMAMKDFDAATKDLLVVYKVSILVKIRLTISFYTLNIIPSSKNVVMYYNCISWFYICITNNRC